MINPAQSVYDIAGVCAAHEIANIIISPGSRSAPLTLAFARHPRLTCRVAVDERSAAFIGLGIAQQTNRPVALVCTSGTAALNYAPAVAEAFYQGIPLVVFTADRPPEWIDQYDGQTIVQRNLYGANCLAYFELPVETRHPDARWQADRLVSEAIQLSQVPRPGPVHINVPLREPLYPEREIQYSSEHQVVREDTAKRHLSEETWNHLVSSWQTHDRKLLVGGQMLPGRDGGAALNNFLPRNDVVLFADITSNCLGTAAVRHFDMALGSDSETFLANCVPDLLVTFGGPVVSKYLKLWLRKFKAREHWHLQTGAPRRDPFQSLTRVVDTAPADFFDELNRRLPPKESVPDSGYRDHWQTLEAAMQEKKEAFLEQAPWSEIGAMQRILHVLPKQGILHLGNSIIVRLANFLSLHPDRACPIFSNRGTSGIDGTLSTAVGSAYSTERMTTILLGDLAFFYDRNALWQEHLPGNLRIILFNNYGGGIFRSLDGSRDLPELERYFEVTHKLSAKNLSLDHDVHYEFCDSMATLDLALDTFFRPTGRPALLELGFDRFLNAETFLNFKAMLREIK